MTKVHSAGVSEQGNVRGNNEDRYHIDAERGIYLVVDGMGGQAAGEEAAEIAVSTLRARLERATDSPDLRIREAIALANNAIYEAAAANPEWSGMACVLTVAVLENGSATLGHVGDSRAYLISAGQIEKITRDHSPVGEQEDAGRLTEDAAMKHPRRNEVYRDVGSEPRTPDDADFVEIYQIPFTNRDALLLCSDGLSDVVPRQRLASVVETYAGDPESALRNLVAEAVQTGRDNVSAVLIEGEDFAKPSVPVQITNQGRTLTPLWVFLGLLAGLGIGFLLRPILTPEPRINRVMHVGNGGFVTVAEAVMTSAFGDIVDVSAGDYPEHVVLKEGVNIIGHNGAKLNGGLSADQIQHGSVSGVTASAITATNSRVEFDNVTVPGRVEILGNSTGALRHSHIGALTIAETAKPALEGNQVGAER